MPLHAHAHKPTYLPRGELVSCVVCGRSPLCVGTALPFLLPPPCITLDGETLLLIFRGPSRESKHFENYIGYVGVDTPPNTWDG